MPVYYLRYLLTTVYHSPIQKDSMCTEFTLPLIKTDKIHVHQTGPQAACTVTPNNGTCFIVTLLAPAVLTWLLEVAIKNCNEHVCKSLFPNINNKQGRQCMYNVNIKAHSCNHCDCGKAISTAYSECVFVVALLIQHAMHMRRVILSSVDSPALQHFSTLTHKEYDVQKKVTEHTKYVFILIQLLSETFLILRRNERDIINVSRSSCTVTVILVRS